MPTGNPKIVIIPPERAAFRLDAHGRWHNQGGPFRKKKIIDYFNRAISRDDRGYYVGQQNGEVEERVYFPYEDTALFVVHLTVDPPCLDLNTGRKIDLIPEDLFVRGDNLYVRLGDETAKFAERALLQLSRHLDEDAGQLTLTVAGRCVRLPLLPDPQ